MYSCGQMFMCTHHEHKCYGKFFQGGMTVQHTFDGCKKSRNRMNTEDRVVQIRWSEAFLLFLLHIVLLQSSTTIYFIFLV